jgi:hypothetical protein
MKIMRSLNLEASLEGRLSILSDPFRLIAGSLPT